VRTTTLIALTGLVAACASSTPPPTPAERASLQRDARGDLELTVRVSGLRSNQGKVLVALFASERGFPGDAAHAVHSATASVDGGAAELTFRGLARGRYAVSVLHDENASGALDTGFLGIPSEGLGASNAAQGRFGPADFEDASFALDEDRVVEIDVRYFP
jgi:uncharacterized protein (DUF2141 family)